MNFCRLCLLTACLSFLVGTASAAILFVDPDYSNNSRNVYHTLPEAHTAANIGDTVYVKGNANVYQDGDNPLTLTKRLVWIGPGYFLTNSSGTQADTNVAKIYQMLIYPEASGTVIEGFVIETYFFNTSSTIWIIEANNVTFRRCKFIMSVSRSLETGVGGIVEQCYFDGSIPSAYIFAYGSGTIIRNNILQSISVPPDGNAAVYNNIIVGSSCLLSNGNIFNNVIMAPVTIATAANLYNNVSSENIGSANNNISNLSRVSLIEGGTHPENQYRLNPTSVANSAGTDGTACGAFGGANPYVNSGMPPIPSISSYSSYSHATPTSGLSITIQATSHP